MIIYIFIILKTHFRHKIIKYLLLRTTTEVQLKKKKLYKEKIICSKY